MSKLGFLASKPQLSSLGIRRYRVDRAVADGTLVRVRRNWVATPEASQASVIAILRGGRLTGATALRSYGIWAGDDHRIHVQVPEDSHRVHQSPLTPIAKFVAPSFIAPGVVTHWSPFEAEVGRLSAWRVTVAEAIARFATVEPAEQVAAVIESAVLVKRMTPRDVARVIRHLPRRLHWLENELSFKAGSGLETIARMRFEALGFHLEVQVQIGVDRVDLVIDGWLVVELDGDEWHEPEADRIRTNRVIRSGHGMLRFGYSDVFERWQETVETVVRLLEGNYRR